jgi:hypothetical protein
LSILNDSFAGESILGLKLFSFSAWNTSLHAFLAFKVSVEKYVFILLGLPLYVICFFSHMVFNILSLYFLLVVLMIIHHRKYLFWSSLFDFLGDSCTWIGKTFSRFGIFSVIILLNIFCILSCTSSSSSMSVILRFGLLMESLNYWTFLSQLLSCLTKISLFFSLISILY